MAWNLIAINKLHLTEVRGPSQISLYSEIVICNEGQRLKKMCKEWHFHLDKFIVASFRDTKPLANKTFSLQCRRNCVKEWVVVPSDSRFYCIEKTSRHLVIFTIYCHSKYVQRCTFQFLTITFLSADRSKVKQNKTNFVKNCPQWGLNSQPPGHHSSAVPSELSHYLIVCVNH